MLILIKHIPKSSETRQSDNFAVVSAIFSRAVSIYRESHAVMFDLPGSLQQLNQSNHGQDSYWNSFPQTAQFSQTIVSEKSPGCFKLLQFQNDGSYHDLRKLQCRRKKKNVVTSPALCLDSRASGLWRKLLKSGFGLDSDMISWETSDWQLCVLLIFTDVNEIEKKKKTFFTKHEVPNSVLHHPVWQWKEIVKIKIHNHLFLWHNL